MKHSLAALFVFFAVLFISSISTEACDLKAYGKTAEQAFLAGVERVQLESKGQNGLDANLQIRILPVKENGLFVAEVHSSRRSGFCRLYHVIKPAEETADLDILPQSDCPTVRPI
ncbi:hypothetical protein [Candidatus Electronema sp. PJ]|uniref:hypothetical protein n=1 Tax=Candidatus Electronema sp. PJ TaxID=3401572 RepID=UPI003AA96625